MTTTPLTIGEIETKLGTTLNINQTPDGKDAKTCLSDGYEIDKTGSVNQMQNAGNVDLVYGATTYWLASPCVVADFNLSYVAFTVRLVDSTMVGNYGDFRYAWSDLDLFLRPVVSLNLNVKLTPNADKTEWALS